MKIVVFGAGGLYRKLKIYIDRSTEVVALIDNNSNLWGQTIDGVEVFSPTNIGQMQYDYVLLMSLSHEEMKHQILEYGVDTKRICDYKTFFRNIQPVDWIKYNFNGLESGRKSVLIVTPDLGYHGGALAATYAGMALMNLGMQVVIVAPTCNQLFIEEMSEKGISFAMIPEFMLLDVQRYSELGEFDYYLLNTVVMAELAYLFAKKRKVILWLHESPQEYDCRLEKLEQLKREWADNILVCPVSEVAARVWKYYMEIDVAQTLEYAIPDEIIAHKNVSEQRLRFCVIGNFIWEKGQDLVLEALDLLDEKEKEMLQFSFVGKYTTNGYYMDIVERIKKYSAVFVYGEKDRHSLLDMISCQDIIVVSSRYETMSLVATESMMMGKVCIISDGAGMAKYVDDLHNGLVFSNGSAVELAEKLKWCLANRSKLELMGKEARETYLSNFTIARLAVRLKEVLNNL